MNFRSVSIAILSFALVACGGGGGESPAKPAYTVTGKVEGVAVVGLSASPGSDGTVSVNAGQEIELNSTTPMNWGIFDSTNIDPGLLDVTNKSIGETTWRFTIRSPIDRTYRLWAQPKNNPSNQTVINIAVKAGSYDAASAKSGDWYQYSGTSTLQDNSKAPFTFRRQVTGVGTDGGYTFYHYDDNNNHTQTRNLNPQGQLLSFVNTAPGSLQCNMTPAEALIAYPLVVGKTWTASWSYDCGTGPAAYHEDHSVTASVGGYEYLVIGGSHFHTYKITRVQKITNSTSADFATSPSKGLVINETCWVDVKITKPVRCISTRTYDSTTPMPNNYPTAQTYELTSFYKNP